MCPENKRALSAPILKLRWTPFVWSTAIVGTTLAAAKMIAALAPLPNISMVFLMAVLFAAVSFGLWPAIYASVLSFLAYNFFFIEPLYSFQIAEPHELLALIVFLIVAIVTSALAGRVRDQVRLANDRALVTRRLYQFTAKLSALSGMDAIADGAVGEIHTSLRRPAVILLKKQGALALAAAWPPEDTLDDAALKAAQLALSQDEAAGLGTLTLPDNSWHFIPLRTRRSVPGVVGIACGQSGTALEPEARALLATLAEQTAAALDRAFLTEENITTRGAAETERMRNILLASVSHDFRTPLAAILGSATSLIDYRDRLDGAAQSELLAQIKSEAEGLDAMVRNLLAMTRIDAGTLELRRDWVDLQEVAQRVVGAARRRGAALELELHLAAGLPLVQADAALVEQALANLVNNASAHTPEGTRVVIDAKLCADRVVLRVTDDGPGIASDIMPRLFEKFVRSGKGEGTGLGLAITKGIIEAHGGLVAAESPVAGGRGARITMTFPREKSQ